MGYKSDFLYEANKVIKSTEILANYRCLFVQIVYYSTRFAKGMTR